MIGFVEVDITQIKKAYNYLKNDEECKLDELHQKKLSRKLSMLTDVINTSTGRNKFFKRKHKVKIKKMLEELVYSSFISTSNYIILRVELASIIQDIIYFYEKEQHDKVEVN